MVRWLFHWLWCAPPAVGDGFRIQTKSAHYGYVCKRSGVLIHYCAEQFENDGSISSVLLKTIKRSMAGEYSRELSVQVFAGQCRLFEMGYRQGGYAGFGFRRQLLDREGKIKGVLRFSERKSIQSDRVVLIPGPEEELSLIREIFTLFTTDLESENRHRSPPESERAYQRSRTGMDRNTLGCMAEKTFLVRLKAPSLALQQVVAAKAEIQEDHLVFANSDGKLAALFLMEIVEGWNVLAD
jgi:hypothetical protein